MEKWKIATGVLEILKPNLKRNNYSTFPNFPYIPPCRNTVVYVQNSVGGSMNIPLNPEQRRMKLVNSKDVYRIMKEVLLRENKIEKAKEHFWIVGLANNNRLLFVELVHVGTFNSCPVGPNEIFRVSIIKGAAKLIFVHNHPSGELIPSTADEDTTNRLIQAGRVVNLPVVDHLIISTRSYISFADLGLMKILELNSQYEPDYLMIERIKEETAEETKTEFLTRLVKAGATTEMIAEVSGLTVAEVRAFQKTVKKRPKKDKPADE